MNVLKIRKRKIANEKGYNPRYYGYTKTVETDNEI